MATYGNFTYGTDETYGRANRLAATRQYGEVYGGFPMMRSRCPALWSAHPTTYTGVAPLAHWQDATRTAQLQDGWLQTETLSFAVADVPSGRYYPGGADVAVLAPDAIIRPYWATVVDGVVYATNGYWGLPYRVRPGVVSGMTPQGPELIRVEAEDWGRVGIDAALPLVHNTQHPGPISHLITLKLYSEGLGMPAQPDTFHGLVYTAAWWASGGNLIVTGAAPDLSYLGLILEETTESPADAFGGPLTPRRALLYLQTWSPFRLFYTTDGGMEIRYGEARRDSGWTLSCQPTTRGGPWEVPWEKLTPSLSQPEYTRAEWWWVNEQDGVVWEGLLAEANSAHPRLPHSGSFARTSAIRDRVNDLDGGILQGITAAEGQARVNETLRQSLGAADTLTVELDSAIPSPPLGDELYVYDPPRVSGWYALTQVTQPLGLGAQSWRLSWRSVA